MSDELEEEHRRSWIERTQPKLTGDLLGAGPLPDDQVDHLLSLWDANDAVPRAQREPRITFVARVYRAARRRERDDAQREMTRRNRALAERIAGGSRMDVGTLIGHVRGHANANLDMPAARAAELADEVERVNELMIEKVGLLVAECEVRRALLIEALELDPGMSWDDVADYARIARLRASAGES